MQEINHSANPFPGLRPFESTETHLFFGRDGQSEELLRRLKRTRFLAVVGTSGSGKSSLVRAGLLPALQGGLMASAGSDWRIAILRPGGDPIGNLARALSSPAVLGSRDEKSTDMQSVLAETTLRRSSLGLVELVSRARTKLDDNGQPLFPDYENLLVVVDQFEELFRFKQLIEEENSKEDAAAFVKLLLEAVGQTKEKIYIVLTMRSDFLGDCSQFWDLPEAINNGQYLIPRMTRDERREAISGPVAVGQGAISEPLVNQLLNDVGDNPDQLPILQHALMRTWDYWLRHRRNGEAIDIPDYNAIGGMGSALSRHADEAYAELTDGQKVIAEKLFKGLTEKGADNREIRRPMEVQEICELTGADEAEVIAVIDVFRRGGRSFLMPPPTDAVTGTPVHLNKDSLIDISHESLIRNWERLKTWVDEESRSARIYRRLAETAVLHREGKAGLWRDPDLQVALAWREQSKPNPVWARRYHPEFALAMSFLDESVKARDAQIASEEARRRKEIKRTRLTAVIFALAFLFSLAMGVFAYSRKTAAENSLTEATKQRAIAEKAQEETKGALDEAKKQQAKAEEALSEAKEQRAIAEEAKARAVSDQLKAQAAEKTAAERAAEAEKQRQRAEEQTLLAQNNAEKAEEERRRAEDEAKKAAINEKAALENARKALEQIIKNRQLLYSSNIGVAQKAIEDNNDERAQKLLQGLIPDRQVREVSGVIVSDETSPKETTDLRGFEWYYLWGLANRKLATFKLADAQPASSPNADRPVTPIASSGGIFAIGGGDKAVRVWAGRFQSSLGTFTAHNEPITSVALRLAGRRPELVPNWSVAVGGKTTVEIYYPASFGGFAPAGSYVKVQRTIKLKGSSDHTALDFSKKHLAIGNGGTFILWDAETDQDVTLAEGGEGFASVAFVEDDKTLITCDGRKLTRWDVATRRPSEIKLLVEDSKKPFIKSIAFTPDGRTMVTNGEDTFMVWVAANADATAYALKTELPAHKHPAMMMDLYNLVVAISPDGHLLATGDGTDLKNGGGVKLWDISGEQPKELFTLSPNVEDATSLAFSTDNILAVGGRNAVQFWDAGNKEPFRPIATSKTLLFTPDQKSFVREVYKHAVRLRGSDYPIPRRAGFMSRDLTLKQGVVYDDKNIPVALAPNGHLLAVRGERVLRLWNIRSSEAKLQATIENDPYGGVAFSPDGKTIATASRLNVVKWWSTDKDQSRTMETTVEVSHVNAMAFSPDGKILAVGGGDSMAGSGLVTLWDAQQKSEQRTALIQSHPGVRVDVTSLAFSPDSQILATGGSDKNVELWNVNSNTLIATLEGHISPVTSVAYSPDGKTIASGDQSGTVNLWSASSYQLLLTLKVSSDPITVVAFSPNGEMLFTNDGKGEILLWPATPREEVDRLLQQVSSIAPRFSPDDRPISNELFSYKKVLSGVKNNPVKGLEYLTGVTSVHKLYSELQSNATRAR